MSEGPGVGYMLARAIPLAAHGPGNKAWITYDVRLAIEKAFLRVAPVEAIIEASAFPPPPPSSPPVLLHCRALSANLF